MLIIFIPDILKSQSLPVGTPVLEDYYRKSQLLGKIDPAISFTVRPIFPSASIKLDNGFDLDSLIMKKQKRTGIFHFFGKFGKIQILPVIWENQFNTHHPYSLNDGAMIPARGYQTILSTGIYVKLGPLDFQIRPELVYAQNRSFQGFYKEQPENIRASWYTYLNFIDLPEQFGRGAYRKIFPGQSSVRLTIGPISAGVSNENLWWGPGMRNSLMMSNTAPGFEHFTINTVRPIKTFIGSFEGQIIGGRLDNSQFAPFDTTFEYNNSRIYVPKRNDWRYINGFVLSYQPVFVEGLFMGLTRTFTIYNNDLGNTFKSYLPIITPIDKKSNYGNGESIVPGDQIASAFFRWVWFKEKGEIYAEFLREDHAFDARDFVIDPDHTHAYIFGVRKLFPIKRYKNQYIQFSFETTQLAYTKTNPERIPSGPVYTHVEIHQGYTNDGQILGAGAGPGSNMQTLTISWVKNLKSIGVRLERYVHNYDFYTTTIKDIRANWVDFNTTLFAEWNYKNFVFSARTEIIRCYNYQFLYRPDASNPPNFWDPGNDVYNYQGNISVMYRF